VREETHKFESRESSKQQANNSRALFSFLFVPTIVENFRVAKTNATADPPFDADGAHAKALLLLAPFAPALSANSRRTSFARQNMPFPAPRSSPQ